MANRAVNGVVYLNAFTYSAGDSLDLSGAAILYANVSSLDISIIYFNSPLQRLVLQNASTTDIVILNITGSIYGTGGTIEMDTGFVSLSSPYVVPVDSLGNRPTRIGYFVADGQTYTECTSFATMRADDARLDAYSTFNPATDTVEGSETYDQSIRLIRAEAAGKVAVSGDDVSFRDAQDTKNRIQATTDSSGNRSVVVTDGS
tara:strand:- start:141 stop:749 length:609 start_codon:yes stop_codon:yes gene_type:complete